jgi:hypothetical protein
MQFLIIWLFLGLAGSARAQTIAIDQIQTIAASTAWHRLLHYEKGAFGRLRSLADGKGFFFAADGKTNPEAELRASLKAMFEDRKVGKQAQHPQCAFPERFRFLKEKLGIRPPEVKCPKFETFMATFNDPKSLSLIFSSSFPNNPASMFGHTFLRVQSSRPGNNDLLDMGINYAAFVSPDENPFAFIFFGITGGYIGTWSVQPYYVKVHEYSNFESRDLWEYELNMTPNEVRRFLAHLWEMETNSTFDYYFFDENCSYQILSAIAAIRPEWDILKHKVYVIPGETVKNLAFIPDVVRDIQLRPSAHHRLFQRYEVLSAAERKEFFAVANGKTPVSSSSSRFVLDAVAAYYDYLRNEAKGKYQSHYEQRRAEVLSHRAKLGLSTQAEMDRLPPLKTGTQPELGHDPYALSLGGGWREQAGDQGEVLSLRLRTAYHDLLNRDMGFTRLSHIDFPWMEIQYDGLSQQLRLEQFGGLAVTSLYPWSLLDQRISWRFQGDLFTARDYGCATCRHVRLEGGIGAAANMGLGDSLLYAFTQVRTEFYHRLERGYRAGPGIEVGAVLTPAENYKIRLGATEQWFLDQERGPGRLTQLRFDHAYSLSRNREIRQTNLKELPHDRAHLDWWESRIEMVFFFR